MPGRKILLNRLLLLCVLASLFSTRPALASEETDFMAARDAYASGNSSRLDSYAKKFDGSVLEIYPQYWQQRMHLETSDQGNITAFLSRYDGTLLADQLRKEWLRSLGRKQKWALFSSQYPLVVDKTTDLACFDLQARKSAGDSRVSLEARQIWHDEKAFPDSCLPLFSALIAEKEIGSDEVWAKIRYALSEGNLSLFRQVNRFLPAKDAFDDKAVEAAYVNPSRYLDKNGDGFGSRAEMETVFFAIARIARSTPDQAYPRWLKMRATLPDADRRYLVGQIARQGAMNHYPDALQWFSQAGDALGDGELEWKARAALRALDWKEVAAAIDSMSAPCAKQEVWRYWKARALKARGKAVEANVIFAALSHEYDFYGQLSLEELGTMVSIPPDNYKPSSDEVAKIERNPAIFRALQLYQMNLRIEGHREWDWALRTMDDKSLLAAAEVARGHHLYDRAIYSAEKTVALHDFSLRYLAPYREIMSVEAKQQNLDEAWVYGLIRQESRFITGAKSSVGASGLMQLMPATAKWVARKIGLRDFRQSLTSGIALNISLGTYYLKHVLGIFDNQSVLASAAYNAGPVRARQWIDSKAMEGAIYAETIPFSETRGYVKKVMSNTEYYASSFGQEMRPLKERLGVIAPRSPNNDLPSLAGEP